MISERSHSREVATHVVAAIRPCVGNADQIDPRHFVIITNDLRPPVTAANDADAKASVFVRLGLREA